MIKRKKKNHVNINNTTNSVKEDTNIEYGDPAIGLANDPLTERIIRCCYKVHNALGSGLVERIYRNALMLELKNSGLKAKQEQSFTAHYDGFPVGKFFADIVVEDKIILEIKAIGSILPFSAKYQILSCLKASGLKRALLINFGSLSCRVQRFVF